MTTRAPAVLKIKGLRGAEVSMRELREVRQKMRGERWEGRVTKDRKGFLGMACGAKPM